MKMSDQILAIMFDRLEKHNLQHIKDELISVIQSAEYEGAQNYAREEIIHLWEQMETEITKLQEPPTEEQLKLEHPEMQ